MTTGTEPTVTGRDPGATSVSTPGQKAVTVCYVLDPMCSWCWAFRPSWESLTARLPPSASVRYVMGGLAPDSDLPMPPAMRTHLKNAWRQIAERTGARFNMAFWDDNEPRRSTYPACRAVIAAGRQLPGMVPAMIEGIQRAYYLHARNPSDLDTLVDVAGAVGLDTERFTADLESDIVRVLFERDREDAVAMGVEGFPSVIARDERGNHWITRGWCDPQNLIARWDAFASA